MQINWHNAPVKTTYGAGMKCADVALDKDSTLTLACHEDDIEKVNKLLNDIKEYKYHDAKNDS
jgi:hypothetical protein